MYHSLCLQSQSQDACSQGGGGTRPSVVSSAPAVKISTHLPTGRGSSTVCIHITICETTLRVSLRFNMKAHIHFTNHWLQFPRDSFVYCIGSKIFYTSIFTTTSAFRTTKPQSLWSRAQICVISESYAHVFPMSAFLLPHSGYFMWEYSVFPLSQSFIILKLQAGTFSYSDNSHGQCYQL